MILFKYQNFKQKVLNSTGFNFVKFWMGKIFRVFKTQLQGLFGFADVLQSMVAIIRNVCSLYCLKTDLQISSFLH